MEELCAEGYLVKMQGRGTFVSKPRIHRKFTSGKGAASFTEICKENGMVPGARLLNRQIVPVRKDEEAFFHVGSDALLIYIQRLPPPMVSRYFWRTCSCPTSLIRT